MEDAARSSDPRSLKMVNIGKLPTAVRYNPRTMTVASIRASCPELANPSQVIGGPCLQ